MNAGNANVLNAITLMAMSAWGYQANGPSGSKTVLIPLIFGVILLVLSNSIREHNKTVAHIAVVITLIALIALIAKPLPGAIQRGNSMAILRVGAMVLTGVISMIFFIKSFIDARKNRETRL